MEDLIPQEEQAMRVFWKIERGIVRDILDHLPEPKPPYTTLASTIKSLEKKGYLGHKTYGKTHEYFVLIMESEYKKKKINRIIKDFFEGSVENVLSFLVSEKKLTSKELEEVNKLIEKGEES
ncbi:BlaI/MecI/CopY family transcriptional regulator [Aquiflexum sp.]|uniref:BlaI/MecI/CopY family transcriptional regulator n=1 Tax=Aquiflexum sp. TaxID=1872584 RepID=UPI003593B726